MSDTAEQAQDAHGPEGVFDDERPARVVDEEGRGRADEEDPERVSDGERRTRRRERRNAAVRGAERALARLGFLGTLRERLALLDAAPDVYDLDETSDIYGNGVVEALEEKVAGLLGTEAAAFFPTGTMAQQVALRCWTGRTGSPTVALHGLAHPELHE